MEYENIRERLTKVIFGQRSDAMKYESYYLGTNPISWVSREVADEVSNYGSLNLNYSRVVADELAQRLEPVAFNTASGRASEVNDQWEACDLAFKSQAVMTDALVYGRGYWLVWSGPDGAPNVTPESSLECAVLRDPLTGTVVAGYKRWAEIDGTIRGLLFTEADVVHYVAKGQSAVDMVLAGQLPYAISDDMTEISREPNPFGRVPLVPLTNRPRLTNSDGESELTDVVPLVDMLNKFTLDSLVTSSYSAFPRRWVTGLFPSIGGTPNTEQAESVGRDVARKWQHASQSRLLVAPSDSTKFGQFPEANMTSYRDMILLTLAQIAAIGCIPPSFMATLGMNPQSAEAMQAQEARLVAKAVQRQRQWSQAFEDLMRLTMQVADGYADPALRDLETVWKPAEDKSLPQIADAVVKLYAGGVIDQATALAECGYSPQAIQSITSSGMAVPRPKTTRTVVRDAEGNIQTIVEN